MTKFTILSREHTQHVVDLLSVINDIEQVYLMKHHGSGTLMPMIFHEFNPGVADMDIKSGTLTERHVFGSKMVAWFGDNAAKGLPTLTGIISLYDLETGMLKGIVNGDYITGIRTGAAGAIGSKYLANKDATKLLLVGTGHQSRYQVAAHLASLPQLEEIMVYDPMGIEHADAFVSSISDILNTEFISKYDFNSANYKLLQERFDVTFTPIDNLEQAVRSAHIIVTATPSRKALIQKEWVQKGTHFSCMGSDMSGKQEIDETIFGACTLVVDDIGQALNVGEIETALKENILNKEDVTTEIGAVIAGDVLGRQSHDDITVFDSTGIALQDLIVATTALEQAELMNVGQKGDI